jgi:hypothetical protein
MKVIVRASQEKTEAAINSIHSELENTITNWAEDIPSSVNKWTQGLREEMNAMIEETQLGL